MKITLFITTALFFLTTNAKAQNKEPRGAIVEPKPIDIEGRVKSDPKDKPHEANPREPKKVPEKPGVTKVSPTTVKKVKDLIKEYEDLPVSVPGDKQKVLDVLLDMKREASSGRHADKKFIEGVENDFKNGKSFNMIFGVPKPKKRQLPPVVKPVKIRLRP